MLAGVNPTQYVTMMSCICLYQCVSLGMDKLLVRHTNDDPSVTIAVYLYAFWREFNTICLYDELPMSLSICLYDIIECITVRFNADLGEYITVSMAL